MQKKREFFTIYLPTTSSKLLNLVPDTHDMGFCFSKNKPLHVIFPVLYKNVISSLESTLGTSNKRCWKIKILEKYLTKYIKFRFVVAADQNPRNMRHLLYYKVSHFNHYKFRVFYSKFIIVRILFFLVLDIQYKNFILIS